MTITNKITEIKETGKAALRGVRAVALGLGICMGVTAAANVPPIALQAGIEYLLDQPRQESVGLLRNIDQAHLLGTHGLLYHGTFELEDGSIRRIYDSPRILDGKWLANTEIPDLEVGRRYQLSTIGSETLGYTLLDAHTINE